MNRTYRIMLADDEGIVIDSLKYIIEKQFPERCEIQSAKTGRSLIELAETFRPDIAFIDIQMPGINGIEAMKEIRKLNSNIIFIVLSAYDKFDYAREAIGLGVLEYLNKPFSREVIGDVLNKAFVMIDTGREKRNQELNIREKMETITPFVESGLIYSVIFSDNDNEDREKYKQLLDFSEDYGFIMVLTFGAIMENGVFRDSLDTGIKIQSLYPRIREYIRETFKCFIGPPVSNKIICFVPSQPISSDYNARVEIINKCSHLNEILFSKTETRFRIGIGTVQPLNSLADSYREALTALKTSTSEIAHANDLSLGCEYDENYPIEDEKALFDAEKRGDVHSVSLIASRFFDWMVENYHDHAMDIRLKCLEFVLWAERQAYLSGGMTYHFTSRGDYLPSLINLDISDSLRKWFLDKLTDATYHFVVKKEKSPDTIVSSAKEYIQQNYSRDISLDDVSRSVDVSPYYFSRLFKEDTGVNFIEYLTSLRVEHAKSMLSDSSLSMKDICNAVGYSDPNYFSRMFKKNTGYTPTEFKDSLWNRR